jgi:Phosphate-selective porin O and P
MRLTIGNTKPPFSRTYLTSSKRLQMIERSFTGEMNFRVPDPDGTKTSQQPCRGLRKARFRTQHYSDLDPKRSLRPLFARLWRGFSHQAGRDCRDSRRRRCSANPF